jgi:putative ABC transport system permease protein
VLEYLWRNTWRQLLRYSVQNGLVVLGVAIGVGNIIALVSLTDLGRQQTTGMIKDFGANLIFVSPYFDMEKGPLGEAGPSSVLAHLPAVALDAVRQSPAIGQASGVFLMPGHVGYGAQRCFTTFEGVSPAFASLIGFHVGQGRFITEADTSASAAVVCLGETVRRGLFGESGGLGEQVVIKGRKFTVVGVMESKGRVGLEDMDNRLFVPLPVLQELFEYDGLTGIVASYRDGIKEPAAVTAVKEQLGQVLKPGQVLDETFSVFTVKDARRLLDSTLGIFRAVLSGIASIALLVAGIGIMNVMLIRVIQRRQEIGIRQAAGATPRAILGQFLFEAAVQAAMGAVIGIGLGYAGVFAYCRYAGWEPFISPWTALGAVAFSVGIGLVFGAYPAWRASRLDPIICLRTEN